MKTLLIALTLSTASAAATAAKPYELWYDKPAPDLPIVSKAHLNVNGSVELWPEDPAWEASAKPLQALRDAHRRDYRRLFERAAVDLRGQPSTIPTDRLLADYKAGKHDRYLEELYFNSGRYLLIASSRPGTLPPNLQGIWSQYEVTP